MIEVVGTLKESVSRIVSSNSQVKSLHGLKKKNGWKKINSKNPSGCLVQREHHWLKMSLRYKLLAAYRVSIEILLRVWSILILWHLLLATV